jgi:hypothetical protein
MCCSKPKEKSVNKHLEDNFQYFKKNRKISVKLLNVSVLKF